LGKDGVSPRCGDGLSLPSNRPAEGRGFIPANKTGAKRATFALPLSQQPFAFAVHVRVHNPLNQHFERTDTYSKHGTLATKLKGTAAMRRGRIGWWNCERGFGFIHDENSDKTYFVHLSRIQADGRPARR
jgi:cold-shock-like DNA binding protein